MEMSMKHLLNSRSHFSMGRSVLKPKTLITKAAELGYETVAMIDDGTLSGMTHLFSACKGLETPIKAICGVNIKVFDDPLYRPPSKRSGEKAKINDFWEAKLIVKNEVGLKALFRLLSAANSPEYFYYTPRIGLKELIVAMKSEGLILLTGDFHSLFAHPNAAKIYHLITKYIDNANRFVELIPVKSAYFDRVNTEACLQARLFDSNVIYSRPCLYLEKQDNARDVMSYIIGNSNANNRLRNIPFNRDLHMLTPDDYQKEIESMQSRLDIHLLDRTEAIVEACTYEWQALDMCLPKMAENEFKTLTDMCKEGWKTRLATEVFGYKPTADLLPKYKDRLQYELKVLRDMGFDRYFLLVADVIKWCKDNDILVAPGRGSSAGSLVAYLVGITDVDPLRFNLIFERFLNPDRLDYPDIDSDFMSSRRHEVIEYITDKFGQENVAGISNYTALGSASAVRDVGRIYQLPQDELRCTKVIEQGMSLDVALELPEIQKYAAAHPDLMDTSLALEGSLRSLGRHAAGVVVAGEPLLNRCVVESRKGEITVNWDKRTVEDWGLIKLDILGLSTLDTLAIIAAKVKARRGITIEWDKIPLNDKDVLQAFTEGKTTGVFQFSGGGMRKLLKDMGSGGRTLTFEDVVAATALYRPGPLESGMTETYVRIKQGIGSPEYPHPKTEAALLPTKGVIIYQEQVMQIARDLCGYTMGEADYLRKIMGKKLPEEMAKQKDKFVSGAVTCSGMDKDEAAHLFDEIEKFAGYGFNKSHAVSYSLISYACLFAKTHYPAEYFAAALSIASEDELRPIVKDALAHGLVVVPPDINISTNEFEIGHDDLRDQDVLYAPLDRVKMVSKKGVDAILEARAKCGGQFTSLKQFESAVNRRSCNKRAIDNMNKVGAFVSIETEQIDARHPDRLRDQKQLIPNLMLNNVKADRRMLIDGFIAKELKQVNADIKALETDDDGDPTGVSACIPNTGKKPMFMVITDYAAYSEMNAGKFADGKSFNYMMGALREANLKKSDAYYTGLVKTKKADKMLSGAEINKWSDFLDRELALLKPAVIVAAGSAIARYLCPDVKGGWEDLAGQVIYDVKRDCSILLAPNPQMIYAKPDVQNILDNVLMEVAEILN